MLYPSAGGAFHPAQAFIFPNILSLAGLSSRSSLYSPSIPSGLSHISFQLPARKEGFFL
jgi:hypothetical protein